MDLRAWLTENRVVDLLDLIDQLPAACRLNEAIAQDDEAADQLVALTDGSKSKDGPSWSPRVAEFDLTNMILVSLVNEVKMLRQSGVALAGGKPKKEPPFPAPKTAIDRARERQDLNLFHSFQSKFGFGRTEDK